MNQRVAKRLRRESFDFIDTQNRMKETDFTRKQVEKALKKDYYNCKKHH